jgi:hypothetical protein
MTVLAQGARICASNHFTMAHRLSGLQQRYGMVRRRIVHQYEDLLVDLLLDSGFTVDEAIKLEENPPARAFRKRRAFHKRSRDCHPCEAAGGCHHILECGKRLRPCAHRSIIAQMPLLMIALFLGLLSAFALAAPAAPAAHAPNVLVSIKPLHSIVAAVMEGVATPELLLTGAASPHSYALKPSDARKIARADVIFWTGPVLETFLETPLANLAPRARVVALSDVQGVTRLPARKGGVWEAAAFASYYQLDNLVAIVDVNGLGQSQRTMYDHDVEVYAKRFAAKEALYRGMLTAFVAKERRRTTT